MAIPNEKIEELPSKLRLQHPNKWTNKHFEAANTKERLNVSRTDLIGEKYVPKDGGRRLIRDILHV